MKRLLVLVGAMLVLTLLLTGCTSQPAQPPATHVTTPEATTIPGTIGTVMTPPSQGSFPTGVTWRLFSYNDGKGGMASVVGDQPITALFRTDGSLTGSSGCNQYFANYTTSGSSIRINLGGSTLMACAPAVMDQESRYFALLASTSRFAVNGDTMLFYDSTGQIVLAYKQPVSGPSTPGVTQPAIMGSWDLLTYNNGNNGLQSVALNSSITALFTPDGRVSGSAGCNQYSAAYTLNGANIGISLVSSTKMMCDPDLMTQETQYLALLKRAYKYDISGDRMTIYNALGDRILDYKRNNSALPVTPVLTQGPSPQTIVGAWDLKSFTDGKGGNIPVLAAAPITAKFAADGNLSGSSGCNQYVTSYSLSGTSLTISPAASTRMACEPAVMTQENVYLVTLTKASRYVISGDSLVLYDSSGATLLNYQAH